MRKFLLFLLLLISTVGAVSAATVTQQYSGSVDTLMSISTNIATAAGAIGSEISWATAGYPRADCELNIPSFSGVVVAGAGVTVWLLIKPDGTNYEDGSATIFPLRTPDMFFPLRAVSTAQRVTLKDVPIPIAPVTALLRNDSGVTLQGATQTWTLKCRPRTFGVN